MSPVCFYAVEEEILSRNFLKGVIMKKNVNFQRLIIEVRVRYELSREEFAKLVGVSPRAVGHWEDGDDNPSEEHASKILKVLAELEKNSDKSKHETYIDISKAELPVIIVMKHLTLRIDLRKSD